MMKLVMLVYILLTLLGFSFTGDMDWAIFGLFGMGFLLLEELEDIKKKL